MGMQPFLPIAVALTLGVTGAALAQENSDKSDPGSEKAADKIYFGGPIVTMNDANLFVEAVATKGDEITATGRLRDVEKMAGEATERVDLEGRTMMPGFIDGHSHFLVTGTYSMQRIDLNPPPIGDVESIDDIVSKLSEQADQTRQGDVIVGMSYDDTLVEEMRHPTREDLDKVSTEVPVIISHISGHLAVGNSKALEMAEITAETSNPDGGRIEKDESGEPTGVMEGNARELLYVLIPETTQDEWIAGIGNASNMWAAPGFTTASDNLTSADQIDLFKEALEEDELKVRVNVWPRVRSVEAVHEFPAVQSGTDLSDDQRMIVQGPVKFTIDGSPQGYTANFSQPYTTQRPQDDGNYSGFPYWDDRDQFFDIVETLHREGYQLTVHGNGDQGIQDVLDA